MRSHRWVPTDIVTLLGIGARPPTRAHPPKRFCPQGRTHGDLLLIFRVHAQRVPPFVLPRRSHPPGHVDGLRARPLIKIKTIGRHPWGPTHRATPIRSHCCVLRGSAHRAWLKESRPYGHTCSVPVSAFRVGPPDKTHPCGPADWVTTMKPRSCMSRRPAHRVHHTRSRLPIRSHP